MPDTAREGEDDKKAVVGVLCAAGRHKGLCLDEDDRVWHRTTPHHTPRNQSPGHPPREDTKSLLLLEILNFRAQCAHALKLLVKEDNRTVRAKIASRKNETVSDSVIFVVNIDRRKKKARACAINNHFEREPDDVYTRS